MQKQLENLEISFMEQERMLESMSKEMFNQQRQIRLLEDKLRVLEERLKMLAVSQVASESEETPPPHY